MIPSTGVAVIVGSVQKEALYAIVRTVGVQREAALRIFWTENVEGGVLYTGSKQSKGGKVASEIGQILNGALVQDF